MPSAAAIAAGVAARRAQFEARVAAGKKFCKRHPDGGAWLALTDFSRASGKPDGRHSQCSACAAKDKRDRYARDPVAAAAARASARARMAARRTRRKAEAEQARAQQAAEAEAARIEAAILAASDIGADRDQLRAALAAVPPGQLEAIARARAAQVRAKVDGQRERARVFSAWVHGKGPPPEPFYPAPGELPRR